MLRIQTIEISSVTKNYISGISGYFKYYIVIFIRVIIGRQAEPFLNAVGFDVAPSGTELTFTCNDNVRLYLASSLLDMILGAIETEGNVTSQNITPPR